MPYVVAAILAVAFAVSVQRARELRAQLAAERQTVLNAIALGRFAR